MRKVQYNIIIVIILILVFILYVHLSLYFPIDGDGAYHANLIKETVKEQKIINNANFTLTSPDNGFPTMYPYGFYIIGSLLYMYIGDLSFELINVIFAIFLILSIYLFSRRIINEKYGLIIVLISISSTALILNTNKFLIMDIVLTFIIFYAIYFFYLSFKYPQGKYYILLTLFFTTAIFIKQQSYILIIIFLVFLLVNFKKLNKQIIINYLKVLLVTLILLLPSLIMLFFNTGTFLYPGVSFPMITNLENSLSKNLGINNVPIENQDFKKYAEGVRERMFSRYKKIDEVLDFFSPINVENTGTKINIFSIIYFLLLLFGLLFLIIKKQYLLGLVIIIGYLFLIKIGNARYFLFTQIFGYIIMGVGIFSIKKNKSVTDLNKKLILIGIVCIIVITLCLNLIFSTQKIYEHPNLELGPIYSEGRLYDLINASEWIKNNTPNNTIIATSRTHLVAFYSGRTTVWITAVGGTEIYEAFLINNTFESIKIFKDYNVDYLLISNKLINDKVGIWPSYYPSNGLVSSLDKDKHFLKVFENNNNRVYKIIYNI